ncbi:MarR family transcriptional regulator [uncultured Gemmiger sp.]|uniref:MarR family winged helix-turn-helix transcriptional regulator n=1 Tax=uncultured Gemmiger sp. TaxID=1623490 RepID=UPI0025CE83EB|nr:MarR family transcriptional regulator [uncultured Gemmiger sp.]
MESRFYMLLYRLSHAQRTVIRPRGAALGLGSGQPKLIDYLARKGPCSQKQLADYFEIDPAAVCRMLDALEKGGFASRSVDKNDRRTGTIRLTDKGSQAAAAWQQAAEDVEQQMLAGFTRQEKQQFAAYFRRAYRNLKPDSSFGREPALPQEETQTREKE